VLRQQIIVFDRIRNKYGRVQARRICVLREKEMQEARQRLESDPLVQHYIQVLKKLIAYKSIFAQETGLTETAHYLKGIFQAAGAQVILDTSYRAPFLVAKFMSKKADAKSLIFYNHYDVQPADEDQIWTTEPFDLDIRDGFMYGRGVDDDKGHITARLTAIQKYLEHQAELPVNILFIIEGAEESASVDLEKYLAKYQDKLRGADLLVWEQGIFNKDGQMEISGGTKGILTFDAFVKSADVDIHSKFGGIIDSSSWYLINALSSLRDQSGKILVEGIYEDILPASEHEMDLVRKYAQVEQDDLEKIYDLQLSLLTKRQDELLKTLFFEPSLSIQGIKTGYQGQGVKTILPAEASAKLEVRLVPGMHPQKVFQQIQAQLIRNGFEKVDLVYTLGEEGYRSDMTASAILKVIDIAENFSDNGVAVLPTTAGTGPMHQVFHALQVPIAAFGIGHPNSRDHGEDENVKVTDYLTHIEMIEELIRSYE
jgi:succinyl-diaminopimelate desuccinylase